MENSINLFFNKCLANEGLKENFKKLVGDVWWNLSFKERVELFENIMEEIGGFYPELGKPKFNFVILTDNAKGEESEEGTFINAKLIEEDNYYEILLTCIHELRHFYQRQAAKLYEEKGIIHELFSSKEELEMLTTNNRRSALFLHSNYIGCSRDDDIEYKLQPVEWDAEVFACLFLTKFSNEFLKDRYDVMNCKYAMADCFKTMKSIKSNGNDIVDFNNIYRLNYNDLVKENKPYFKKEENKVKEIMSLLRKKEYLREDQVLKLLNCCFLEKMDDETKMALFNRYLEWNDCEARIEFLDDGYYFNGLLLDMKEYNVYAFMEPLFLQVAQEKIDSIVSKDLEHIKFGFEKEVKINLMSEKNIIKEEDNPLYYRVQPYMLFRNGIVMEEYRKLIRGVDSSYNSYNNFFLDFCPFLKKYDNISVVEKVEILTGKSFKEIYNGMLERMKSNITLKKTSK